MNFYSINYIDTTEVKSYEPYTVRKDIDKKKYHYFSHENDVPREHTIKQIFEKDSNIVLFALRCLLGAILIIPAKCLGALCNRKFEWVSNLFIRKELFIVVDKSRPSCISGY